MSYVAAAPRTALAWADRGTIARGFRACASGNIAILFGVMLIPVLGAAGVAIDYGRALSVQTVLQSSVDAAVLASRSGGSLEEDAIEAKAAAYFAANAQKLRGAIIKDIDVVLNDNVISMEVKAELPVSIASILGKDHFDIRVKSKAAAKAEDIEIALVLDNTGSMRDYMDDLKKGAKDLVEAVYMGASTSSKLKIAVVPYVGGVNIGNGNTQMAWMDIAGESDRNGIGLSWNSFGYEPGCYTGPGGGAGPGPGTGTTGSLFDLLPTFADAAKALLGISSAHAASAADVPAPFVFLSPCWIGNPKVNAFGLLGKIPNASWKGCVLARPEPYDVDDTPPNPGVPNTMFAPWFWPDENDQARVNAEGYSFQSHNDYLLDGQSLTPPTFQDTWIGWSHWSILKYNNVNATIDEVGPDTLGPNKSCPDPILPLTTTKSDVIAAIDRMVHWNGSGTNVAEGLAWGWRVLSPEAPFTEGAPYGKMRKVIVLMTDGVNNIDPTDDGAIYSDYSAYGRIYDGVIQPPTFNQFKKHVDDRLVQVCQNAKNEGITIYTVAFGIVDQPTLGKLEQCATKPPYAYAPGTEQQLIDAFNSIGSSLSELHLME
jgi:Flp pilus assembly protein TadG